MSDDSPHACRTCGRQRPTRKACFYRITGLVLISATSSVQGFLCLRCATRHFLLSNLHNLFLGWWGPWALLLNLFALGYNAVQWAGCLGLAFEREPKRGGTG
jgi:hypothetical protein